MGIESTEAAKAEVLRAVQSNSLDVVRRVLDVSRTGLCSYLCGKARQGTVLLIESRVERLRPPRTDAA
jgi:hypothetical protein